MLKGYSFITKSSEYRSVYDTGVKRVGRYYVVFSRRSESGVARVGITVSGKVGGAVVRNRARRRTREAIKSVLGIDAPAADMVFVALGRIVDASFDDLVKDISGLVYGKKARR